MQNLHFKLTSKYPQYNNWHQTKHHNKIHWGVFVVFTLLIFGTISRWTPISLAADTVPPTAPTNLTATPISSTQINLSWTASADDVGITGYKIYRCQGTGCAPSTQIATPATNSYSDTGLTVSATYTYNVSAYDAAGNESGNSSLVNTTTLAQTRITRYVDPASPNPGSGHTSWNTAAHDIKTGLQAMSGGDTLIIRDGVYTGANNMIGTFNTPPSADITSGTPEAYTVVRAENDFMVIIDAEQVEYRRPCSINGSYIEVHGIECRNPGDMHAEQASSPVFVQGDHIKLFRVGAVEAGQQAIDLIKGDMSNIFTFMRTSYALCQECYAWGWGKYVYLIYAADHTIIRRSVGRQDGWAGGVGDIFSNYSSTFTEFQNNIALDMDEPRHWHPDAGDALWGGFNINAASSNIFYRGNIVKNITGTNGVRIKDAKGIGHGANYNPGFRLGSTFNTTVMENNTIIDSVCGLMTYDAVSITNNTFANIFNDIDPLTFDWDGCGVAYVNNDKALVKNTAFVNINDQAAKGISTLSDYNAYYGNTTNYGDGSIPGRNDKSLEKGNEINPLWSSTNPSGGLKYPVRIEAGSNLSGRGQGGADIGANIKTKIGVSGTLYGEPGYNVDTGEPLWPFPNEDIIKQRMAAYSRWDPYDNIDPNNPSNPDTYVKGKRGFSADGTGLYGGPITLTSYIWESLGNPCPEEICGSKGSPTITITQPTTSSTYSTKDSTITLSGTATDNIAVSKVTWLNSTGGSGTAQGTTTWSIPDIPLQFGSNTITITAEDTDGNTGTDTIIVTYDSELPSIPAILTATAISSSQINLSWTASTDNIGVTGYKIFRNGSQIATSTTTSYSDTGLTAGTVYTYAVSAYDTAGNESAKSQSVSATTLSQFKPSDLNQDQKVDQQDFDILKQDWNRTDKPVSDLNQDGVVDSRDLGIMMSEWTR